MALYLPLTTYFSVSTSIPNSVATYGFDYEGDMAADYTGSTFDDISVTYTTEGIYYPTITVTDDQNISYTDTIAVIVLNQNDLDALLRAKWSGMLSAMAAQDITGSLEYFVDDTKQIHNDIYNALYSQLPQLAIDMQVIEPVYKSIFSQVPLKTG